MAGRRSIYTPQVNAEIKTNIMMTLDEATDADTPTTDWLKAHNIILARYTPQKLSRCLNELWEMGLVQKGKSKRLNKMVYRLTAKIDGKEIYGNV